MKSFLTISFVTLFFFSLTSCSPSKKAEKQTILEKIANAHGIQNWKKVTKLNYTFNVDRGDSHYDRSWAWQPKTSNIKLTSKTDTVSYIRNTPLDSIYLKTDSGFINDKFWLLAPFNLIWDKDNFTFTETVNQIMPISGKSRNKLTIVYKNEGGYTPGDAYDFYYSDNFLLEEWSYRKANQSKPSLSTTWETYKTVQGLKIATVHKNKEGTFKLFFTELE